MQYVFSMTSRMVTIAACCALLLGVLLFLLGIEIGARFVAAPAASDASAAAIAHAQSSMPDFPAAASSPVPGDMAAVPASSS